jgi:hypothetical protein
MRPYSTDLRERIIAAVDRGDITWEEYTDYQRRYGAERRPDRSLHPRVGPTEPTTCNGRRNHVQRYPDRPRARGR